MSSVLPSSAEDLERTLETVMGRLLEVPTGVNAHTDADQCPEDLLPFLAWYLSVDTWNSSWSVEEKREAIRNSVTVHSRKGTRAAVKLGLLTLDLTSEIVEWFQTDPAGDPGTFSVDVLGGEIPISAEMIDDVATIVDATKNLRSHLTGINITALSSGSMYMGAVTYAGDIVTVYEDPAA